MDHPGVAKVFDGGVTPTGRPYFVMEHVQGRTITEFCDEQRLTIRQRIELFIPVCMADQHAGGDGRPRHRHAHRRLLVGGPSLRPAHWTAPLRFARAAAQESRRNPAHHPRSASLHPQPPPAASRRPPRGWPWKCAAASIRATIPTSPRPSATWRSSAAPWPTEGGRGGGPRVPRDEPEASPGGSPHYPDLHGEPRRDPGLQKPVPTQRVGKTICRVIPANAAVHAARAANRKARAGAAR